ANSDERSLRATNGLTHTFLRAPKRGFARGADGLHPRGFCGGARVFGDEENLRLAGFERALRDIGAALELASAASRREERVHPAVRRGLHRLDEGGCVHLELGLEALLKTAARRERQAIEARVYPGATPESAPTEINGHLAVIAENQAN